MGSGFVSSALGSTGASEYISGMECIIVLILVESTNTFKVTEFGNYIIIVSSPLPAVSSALSPWTSGKILNLKR